MNWIKVTDALPPLIEGTNFSKKVWVVVVDTNTDNRRVEESYFAHADGFDYRGIHFPEVNGFVCEYETIMPQGLIADKLIRKQEVKVTHWMYVELPEPPKDEEDL